MRLKLAGGLRLIRSVIKCYKVQRAQTLASEQPIYLPVCEEPRCASPRSECPFSFSDNGHCRHTQTSHETLSVPACPSEMHNGHNNRNPPQNNNTRVRILSGASASRFAYRISLTTCLAARDPVACGCRGRFGC